MSKLLEQINTSEKTTGNLASFIDLIGGGTPKTTVKEYWNGNIPWLSVVDFNNDSRWVSDAEKKITEAGVQNSSTRILEKNDIIISARGTVGVLAQLSRPMAFNQSCYGIRAKSNIDQGYLFYLLKTSIPNLLQIVHGAVFDTITKDSFEQINVSIPDIPTQKKIAEILSAYDAKIENNNKIIKNLEATAQTIFNEWFVNFRFPGYEKVKMVESEMGEIPEGWEAFKLRDLFAFIKGKKPAEVSENQKEGFLQQILIDSFENGKKLYADKQGMVVASDEDLLMVMDGASSGRIEFGIRGIVGSTMSKLQLNKPIRSTLYFYLKSKEKDIKNNTSGSAIPHTDKEKVYGYEIALPKDTEYFESTLLGFIKGVERLNHENISLKQSRDQLLTKLI